MVSLGLRQVFSSQLEATSIYQQDVQWHSFFQGMLYMISNYRMIKNYRVIYYLIINIFLYWNIEYLHQKLGNETRKILYDVDRDSTSSKRWTDKHARTECSASCSITHMYVRTGTREYVAGVIVYSNVYDI